MCHRRASLCLGLAICFALTACAIALDGGGDGPDAGAAPDTVVGCALLENAPMPIGAGHSASLSDGAALWTFDGALTAGARADGLATRVVAKSGGCPGDMGAVTVALPATTSNDDFATPLDLVRVGDTTWQFYETWRFEPSAAFGVKTVGRGIAKYDPFSGSFDRSGPLMWTADRPAYGQSALIDGTWLYAYGCESASDGWARACYAARVPVAQVGDINAWQYATGIGRFTASPDDAQPVLTGVGDLSLRRHASGRLLATYIKPLDTVLQVRSALGPTGPFSAAHALARCESSAGTFCVGAVQHPELDPDPATIAVTFARASFDPLPAGTRSPRLAFLPLPLVLP